MAEKNKPVAEAVVAGEDAGSKLEKALGLGVAVIDEAQLRALLKNNE